MWGTWLPTDAEFNALKEQVEALQRTVRLLTPGLEDPMFASMVNGSRRFPFGTRFTSPLNASLGYVLRRAAGGAATFTAAPAAITTWSDA